MRAGEGLRRARERYGWDAKVDAVVALYRRLSGQVKGER
jgi:hypothetical protein